MGWVLKRHGSQLIEISTDRKERTGSMNLSKRSLLGLAVAGTFVFVASAANADFTVFGSYNATKTQTVTENVTITKTIAIDMFELIEVDAVAEQNILKNQRNENNFVEDENALSQAEILDDVGATVNGLVLINQAPGFQNNQGNEVSIAYAVSPPLGLDEGVFAHATASVEQINYFNTYVAVLEGSINSDTIGNAGDVNPGPFDGGSGIVDINQAAGHMNNQNNAQSISLGPNTVFALGEVDLGQTNTFGYVDVFDNIRTDTIAGGAFAGFNGIVKVNQSAGSMNNQANIVNIAADTGVTAVPF
jgi:hypothetical protein